MGEALLFGGGGGASGLRNKSITKEAYLNLTEEEKNNPYVVWIIKNADATDFTNVNGAEVIVKALCWEAYRKLSEEDKMDPAVVWVISDKTPEELSILDINTSGGSKYYNINGTPSSTEFNRLDGVDYKLDIDSVNPIANMAITRKVNELESALGGLSFGVTETGGLRITYDDGND